MITQLSEPQLVALSRTLRRQVSNASLRADVERWVDFPTTYLRRHLASHPKGREAESMRVALAWRKVVGDG